MKASLKFRENQNPIVKAKIPLNTLGFPFRSSIETGTSDAKDNDLCLSFSTFFQSGPVLKLFYRPNDSDRPFGLVVKTGVGSLGSPIEAPMTMSAEFNFLRNGSPSFFLQFKPQLGNFSIRRSVSSKKIENDDVQSNNIVSKDEEVPEKKSGKMTWADLFVAEEAAEGLFGGEIHARTVFPIVHKVVGKIGWSLKFPATESDFPMGKMPYMVVNKLGIEHVWKDKAGINRNSRWSDGDMAGTCLALKKELGNLESEKESLWKELSELKSAISAVKFVPAAGGRKVTRMIERLKSRKGRRSGEINKNGAVNTV
ncbi:uncharacterized protein LOC129884093 [Solanum dulcamara]|uniref:uncharacterized protein LOC129884093 n=1 Tax=Solanum dulcamara TaxID=45834 RepID=UPI0024853A93|nr:uncharacterized protein LOC129884093 [Solanum dulcamara]